MGVILQDLSKEQLIAMLEASRKLSRISLKVTDKGGLSAYGLGRFPVTLYRSQWERLLAEADTIRAFIAANSDRLVVKE